MIISTRYFTEVNVDMLYLELTAVMVSVRGERSYFKRYRCGMGSELLNLMCQKFEENKI